jgi:transcriptional regulator, LysR family
MDAMHHFDIALLQALIAVADAGSLTAAAPRLCRSQSAVSEQIRKLEEDCGARLFHRGKKGVSLTPAGQRLLGHARQLVAQHERFTRRCGVSSWQATCVWRSPTTSAPQSLHSCCARFACDIPHLRLHVRSERANHRERSCRHRLRHRSIHAHTGQPRGAYAANVEGKTSARAA